MKKHSLKVMFYSHNTRGFGHAARTLALTWALYDLLPTASVVWATGAKEDMLSRLPPNTDLVKLPSYTATEMGQRVVLAPARLNVPLPVIHTMRSKILTALVEGFRPNVLLVDSLPLGKGRELEPALCSLRAMPGRCICLGMRDIFDRSPEVQKHRMPDFEEALRAYFDHVFLYGDVQVFDTLKAYEISADIQEMVESVGYVVNWRPEWDTPVEIRREFGLQTGDQWVIVNFGGGRQFNDVMARIMTAWDMLTEPRLHLLLVLGPYAPAAERQTVCAWAKDRSRVQVVDAVPFLVKLINAADLFVGTPSYNLAGELIVTQTPAIWIARTVDDEQSIRARSLERLGYTSLAEDFSPSQLAAAIRDKLASVVDVHNIQVDGAKRVADFICALEQSLPDTARY